MSGNLIKVAEIAVKVGFGDFQFLAKGINAGRVLAMQQEVLFVLIDQAMLEIRSCGFGYYTVPKISQGY